MIIGRTNSPWSLVVRGVPTRASFLHADLSLTRAEVDLFCLTVLVTDSFVGALPALFIAGVGAAFQTPAGSKTVMTWVPIEQRGMAMGVHQTGIPLGGALLPFIALHRRLAHRGREQWPGLLRECGAVSARLPKNCFYVRTRHDGELRACCRRVEN